jgi:hypothetical protein
MSPTIVKLAVHLENNQRVVYTRSNVQRMIENPPNTTLTAFFELCRTDLSARTLCYQEVPKKYRYDERTKKWIK